jgi:hypothetical protein
MNMKMNSMITPSKKGCAINPSGTAAGGILPVNNLSRQFAFDPGDPDWSWILHPLFF